MHQNLHQPPAPMIPIPQQLTISPSERHHMYDPSLLHTQQLQQQQQYSPMNTRQQRISVDNPMNASISPTLPIQTPEKKTRTRSKKPSIDSRPIEIQQEQPSPPPQQQQQQQISPNIVPPIINLPNEIINPTPVQQQTINNEQFIIDPSTNVNNGNNIEMNSFVSKSIEEEQKDIEKFREDRGDSRSPSVGSSSAKSESVIKEIPLSGERHRLSRSKSPKSRWHHSPSPSHPLNNQSATIEEEQNSAIPTTNDDNMYVLHSFEEKKTNLINYVF